MPVAFVALALSSTIGFIAGVLLSYFNACRVLTEINAQEDE